MDRAISVDEFEKLYGSTARDVLAYVRRRSPGDADDLVAEVYAVAWHRRTDLPAPMLRRAWLFGVARTLLKADGRRPGPSRTERAGDPPARAWEGLTPAEQPAAASVTG